jgi:hypothetical protein
MVRSLFERHRARHHPITVATVDQILQRAGV